METKRLRWYDHLAVNLFWLGLNIRNNAVGSVFMPYLVDMFVRQEMKNSALGGMRTLGLIVAMLVQPAVGLLSDRSTSRFGRRRPFIFFGVLFDLLLLAAIYFSWDYPSLLAGILLIQVSSNLSHGPLQALIPDLVPEDQRGISSAYKAILELVPLILVGMAVAGLVGQGRLNLAFIATGGMLLVSMVLTMAFVKEQPLRQPPDTPFWPPMLRVLGMLAGILAGAVSGLAAGALVGLLFWLAVLPLAGQDAARTAGVSIGGLVAMTTAVVIGVKAGVHATLGRSDNTSAVRARGNFSWWVINRLLFLAAITSIQGFAPYFLMYAFRMDREAATSLTGQLMTMVGVFTLVTALPGGWLADRFGHKPVIAISGIAAACASFLLLGTVWVTDLNIIYIVGAILGLSTGFFMTANWALGTEIVPPEQAGHYLGVSNLAGAGAGMIGSGFGGPLADYLNSIIPGLGYFTIFACYGFLFLFSAASLRGISAAKKTVSSAVTSPGLSG